MDNTEIVENRSWTRTIIWWETRRIFYNIVMIGSGYLRFYIGYVSIPLVYLVIGLGLNAVYTFGWLVEILPVKNLGSERLRTLYPNRAFIAYLIMSILFVLALPNVII